MLEKIKVIIMASIFICLFLIVQKPVPQANVNVPPSPLPIDPGEKVVQLGENRIGVVDSRPTSGMYGTILVFQYDDTKKTFNYIGTFNYSDYFRNPQKYNIPMTQDTINVGTLSFVGSSTNWEGSLVIKNAFPNYDYLEVLMLKYKGKEDPKSIGKVKYSFKTSAGGGRGMENSPENGIITHLGSGSGAIPVKDVPVTVSITWQGKTENFELK